MKRKDTEIKFRKANRWAIALLGAMLYLLIKEIIFAVILSYYGEAVADRTLDIVLNVLFLALWANGWKGHYVDQGYEGVIKFFGKALLVATLGDGNNWLPLGFSMNALPTKRKTLNIPATAAEKGFEVTSDDGVSMITRVGVPYWYENIVAAILNFDPEGDIDMIRDTTIEVMRRKAGEYPSLQLQKHEVPDQFRTELDPRLAELCKKYPFEIDIPLITIAKFSPSDEVKKAQEQKVIEQGQKEGEIIEANHIQERIDARYQYYLDKRLQTPKEVLMERAREDVLLQLKQVKREIIEVQGSGSNLQKATALIGRNK